ncbi:hypothetical protein HT031_001609 [Scenedesmus sp. PABB004]|nr:hypothetical protein HT031_001609 [Scenedesmus sp. PABB004]
MLLHSPCLPRAAARPARPARPFRSVLTARPAPRRAPLAAAAGRQQQQPASAPAAPARSLSPTEPVGAVDVKPGRRHDRDVEKEKARRYRRTTFDHEQWAAHRSTWRYWRHARGMLGSRIVRGLWPVLAYVACVSTAVCVYETALQQGALPEWGFAWPRIALDLAGPFSLSTFALSLLLVFRTNSSYQRHVECRKQWGTVTNRCRDLARQATLWCEPPHAAAVCRWTAAFPIALMASLREDVELARALERAHALEPDEAALVLAQPHPGTAVLQGLGMHVRASGAKDVEKLRMDESVSVLQARAPRGGRARGAARRGAARMTGRHRGAPAPARACTAQDMMGGCERLLSTPIPLSYTRHTSRFLVCWLTVLPLCVADNMGYFTVPLTVGLAFFLCAARRARVPAPALAGRQRPPTASAAARAGPGPPAARPPAPACPRPRGSLGRCGIEEIGVQVEEPASILPLELYCAKIAANVRQAQAAAAALEEVADRLAAAGGTAGGGARVGGYTLQRPLAAVSNVLGEAPFADSGALDAHGGDDSDASL